MSFSTITVTVNSPLPQRQMKEEIPFEWVRALASSSAMPSEKYCWSPAGERSANGSTAIERSSIDAAGGPAKPRFSPGRARRSRRSRSSMTSRPSSDSSRHL